VRKALPALVVLAALLALWFTRSRVAPEVPPPAQPAATYEYTGSASCEECHPDLTRRWRKTGHALGIKEYTNAAPAKPFDGEIFTARDIDHRLGPGPKMRCEGPGGEMREFPVELVIGVRRVQMFTTSMPGGRIQVLPVFLELPKRRWFDYTDFIFGGPADIRIEPDSPDSWYTWARNFNSRCGFCHTTDYEIGYDPDAGDYKTRWNEMAIGCEACHGPGRDHIVKWRRLEDGPDPIVNPARHLDLERSNQICGMCHAESEVVVPGFRPGDDLLEFMDLAGLEDERHVAPDGRANELIHNLLPIMQSRCGPVSCTRCHDPHGSGIAGDLHFPLSDDRTCTQCHKEIGAALEAHTHHKAPSEGSRCIACHMPRMVIEGGHGHTYDHTISIPSIENTKRFGLSNACRDCHVLEDSGWEYEPFDRWYPGADERNHRVELAAAIAGGRAADPSAKAPLIKLLADQNPVYRAGAARALARYDVDLRPQLDDPHKMVQRAAVEGVAARHPDALEPLLSSDNPVLRRAAALALATKRIRTPFDYLAERPELAARVTAVLEDFAKARPDREVLHFAAGRLQELAGRRDDAIRSYERYLRLFPWDERTRKRLEDLRKR